MTDQTSKEEEKIWDKSWSYNDMKNNSTSWSLAGDSGLLLRLKQFSENLISKSVEIEKKLQKLNHTEQRVYEHEITESKAKETTIKKEKTKEEKELELVNKMNEAVTIGMSIMDTYFEKLDPKQTKNESDQDDDDDEEDKNATETNDTFIYETKDPYVLRSLPYLIGSQAFLDNDHVGLKDLDSEEEEDEEEEDNEVEEQESETESKHSNEDEDKSQLFSPSKEKSRKISDSDTSSSSEDGDDDDDLFKPKATNKGLFDDDDDSSEEDHDNQQEMKQPDMFDKDKEEPTPPKVVAPPVIDFASELSARLANKQNNIVTSTATKQPSPKPAVKQPMQTSNLFDSSEEDQDDNQIFKNTKTVPKSLFDDDEDEDEEEITPVKKEATEPEIITVSKTTMPKSDITSALNDLFAKKAKTKSFLSDEDEQDPLFLNKTEIKPQSTTVTSTKKNVSIFDDDEDDDFEVKKKPEPVSVPKQAPTKSLFDDDDEEEDALFAKPPPVVTPSKPPVTQQAPIVAKKTTLFDSSTDSSPESNLEQAKPKRKSSDSANNKPKANLFGSSDESSTDLFSSTKIAPKQEATEQLFAEEANDSIPELQAKSKPAETLDKQNEKLKTKKSLFDSSTEDEGDDLFKISTTRPPQPKQTIKKASLFDEEDDDLFKTKKEPVFVEPLSAAKEPVFKEPAIPVRKQTDEDLTSKLAEEKLLQSATPSKPVGAGKNMLFNPAALKNSNLFKKLAVQTKSSDESGESDTEVKPVEKKTPVLETPIKPPAMLEDIDNFFTTSVPILPNAPVQPVLSNQNEDLFSNIKVDRAFGDNTLKNAQKDRIKATAGKKRSPANRRPTETTIVDDPFSAPIQSEEAVKPVKEQTIQSTNQQKPSLFDSSDSSPDKMKPDNVKQEISEVNIINNSMQLNFEQKITSRKSLENIFDDDDDDLFTTTSKPTVKQTIESAKPKQSDELKLETEKKKETVSVFDNSLDDFDLFSAATSATTKKKKNEKKVLDNIFGDDTDIFSDVANISSKKKVEEKKNTEITKPAKTNPNKKDLFANISDDDDIFSESIRTTTTKKKDDSKKSNTDKFDDPLNLFNV